MTRTIFIAATLSLAVTLPAAPAQALVARTFLSAAGNDSNNCANVATPCRHLAAAYAATSANGEIYVLDPANYGSLTITGPVSIEGHGWASIAPVSGNPAITINANAGDKINIIGVVLDGTGLANTQGILFTSGGSLVVRDSVIRNFTTHGIVFETISSTPSQLFLSNTLVSDNGVNGVFINTIGSGTTKSVLNNVEIQNNGNDGLHATSNGGGFTNVMVRNSTIANNGASGLEAIGANTGVLVTRSTITGNNFGWTDASSGEVVSYGDNNIDGNANVNTEPPNTLTYK